jgi:hydrogenase/urease accessory protein HupE
MSSPLGSILTRLVAGLIVLGIWAAEPVWSHEVRPAFMQITERSGGHYDILWKQPTLGLMAVHLVPHISGGLLEHSPSSIETTASFEIHLWRSLDPGPSGLEGRTLTIEGLDRTITDALVSITLSNGDSTQEILHSQSPNLTLHLHESRLAVLDFLTLGIRHIVTGPDHLLFLLGLLLIVRDRWMLLKTVSAFTVAHSLTLAGATLGDIRPSTPLLNALIALSILFVGSEAMRAQRDGASLTIRYPWVVAFAFGLLHGMGFATGLTSLGLARSTLLSALVLFNVGVEIGQLAFIALILALQRSFRLMECTWQRPIELLPAYVIGTLGAYWTFQYSAMALGAS